MSLKDELAGMPGGGDLAELIGRVEKINGHAIAEIAQAWRSAVEGLATHGGNVRGSVSTVDGSWQGASADAFVEYMGRFNAAADGVGHALGDAAGELAKAGHTLDGVKNGVNKCGEEALAKAKAIKAEGRHYQPISATAVKDVTDEKIAAEIKPYHEDAGRLIAQAERELHAVATAVKAKVVIKPSFTEVPAPGDESFTPAEGRRVDWVMENAGPATTTAQQATSPTGATSTRDGGSPAAGGSGGGGGGGFIAAGGGASSGGHGGLGSSGPPPAGGGPVPKGQVAEWINEAIEILKAHGYPADKMNPNDIWNIIQHESSGDPNAINNWDSNAAKGTPSKGLMQCIDPTFNAHKLPGHDDIYNPVDNIIAGVRYAIDRYGSVSEVPGVVATRTGGGYRGY